jgi:ubiquinone biosynthesis protein Coq4
MKNLWLRLKFSWGYINHVDTDTQPPIDLIFKFVDTFDKPKTREHIRAFSALPIAQKLYQDELPLRLLTQKNTYPKGTFGYEVKNFMETDDNIIDLIQASLIPYRASEKRNSKFNKYAEAEMWQHDMIHLMNGYDVSALGEVSVLAFTLAHRWRESYSTILFASFFISLRNTFMPSKYPKGNGFIKSILYPPIWVYLRCITEAYLRGRKTKWFLSIDWESYLYMPFEEVKKKLNVSNPPKFWDFIEESRLISVQQNWEQANKKKQKNTR